MTSLILLCALAYQAGCTEAPPPPPPRSNLMIKRKDFGKTKDGQAVDLYTLTNAKGMEVRAITLGGIIHSIKPELVFWPPVG